MKAIDSLQLLHDFHQSFMNSGGDTKKNSITVTLQPFIDILLSQVGDGIYHVCCKSFYIGLLAWT